MIIYDIDKIIREPIAVKLGGKEYQAKEPTLETFGIIQKELEERMKINPLEAQKWLVSLLVPGIDLGKVLKSELEMLTQISLRVLSGDHRGKPKAPEEIMEKKMK